jgi:hypothetical protein
MLKEFFSVELCSDCGATFKIKVELTEHMAEKRPEYEDELAESTDCL